MGRAETRVDGGLGFDDLIGELRDLARTFPDKRTGRNTRFHIRDLIDSVPPEAVSAMFNRIEARLEAEGYLEAYRERKVTLLGDDLYAHQPRCEAALEAGFSFLFVCKPTSHKALYEWLDGLRRTGHVEQIQVTRRKGRRREIDTYEFANRLPLRDGEEALEVNWCQLITTEANGKECYRNAFLTNHAITAENVAKLVEAARARWKVENENNNTLKTQGYHLTYNFGYGKHHLATTLVSLNLLAFLIHTVLDLDNVKYRAIRGALSSRQVFFQRIQALTCYLCFESFEALLEFMLQALKLSELDTS